VLGGGLMRSAQFGVYDNVLATIRNYVGGHTPAEDRVFGFLDYQVVCAGFLGGIGRGLVEGPFEYIKVRRQVHAEWKLSEIFSGSGATIFRNSFLFSAFMIYVDISKQLLPDGGLGPFLTGALCSNMAWLTIWPLDVAKSQLQSGNYQGKGFAVLVRDVISSGRLFRGLLPGLARSTIANGTSMVVYKKVEHALKEWTGGEELL
jgi:phosphotransferase system  glucose/maltose/N-acetylglucosamine-specific IIC component